MKTGKFTNYDWQRHLPLRFTRGSGGREEGLSNWGGIQKALLTWGTPRTPKSESKPCSEGLRIWKSAVLRLGRDEGTWSEGGMVRGRSQSGIALVITLILLAVTLVMAIAFLAISRRERGSVSTTEDAATAKFAADAALAKAEGRIVSQLMATTNPYVFSLVVSTNYINQAGFTNNSTDLKNVNYDYLAAPGGGPLNPDQLAQNIANLFYNPRPPVFYSNDFRFYLDLNRNGRYDTNGWVTNLDNESPQQGFGNMTFQVGDPEWIGVLAHPDQPHGPNNPFIARYCFIAVPANSLDFNYIHNQALDWGERTVNAPVTTRDGYSRDQGVGTWEMNLAAFLTDLNTNRWDPPTPFNSLIEPYTYPEGTVDRSIAFDDARALVAWRYANNYTHPFLASADDLFGGIAGRGDGAFKDNGIDYYTVGQQFTFDTNFNNAFGAYGNPATTPWLGAPLTNQYFGMPSDLFNTNKADLATLGYSTFANNLYSAGTNNSTYDRYTFYRMLGQLGTDTAPSQDKINVNYQNVFVTYSTPPEAFASVPTSITMALNYETNFISWAPRDFFTAAANQLLRAYSTEWFEESPSNYFLTYFGLITNYSNISGYGLTNYPFWGMTNEIPAFGITNVPVYVNGAFVYTPAANRLLQLAANIYDASTNTAVSGLAISNYPSVFRPIFWVTNELNRFHVLQTDVYIRGYQYVYEPLNGSTANENGSIFAQPFEVIDPGILGAATSGGISTSNIWGVPWIVGAKKGFPNFNGMEVDNTFFIERLLQFNRNNITPARTYTTNQMYVMGISNSLVMDDWNSYANNYQNPVTVIAQDNFSFGLSNDAAGFLPINSYFTTNAAPTVTGWPGTASSSTYSFVLPLGTNVSVMQNLSAPFNSPPSTNNVYIYFDGSAFGSTNVNGVTFTAPCFIPTSLNPGNFMDAGTPPLPHLFMQTTNRLRAYMLDTKNPNGSYILDYVQLGGMNGSMDVNQAIADPDGSGLWSTNNYAGNTPFGVYEQFLVCDELGTSFPSVDSDEAAAGGGQVGWTQAPVPGVGSSSPAAQISYFRAFFSPINEDNSSQFGTVSNIALSIQAPFTPMRREVQRYVYQINDPLVHYLTQDLYDFQDSTNGRNNLSLPPPGPQYVAPGDVSDRYMPWGAGGNLGNATLNGIPADNNPFNLSYKDPLVGASDNWDFPTNKYPTVGWLGRVHRGTPWQTVYLKSSDILVETNGQTGRIIDVGVPTWQIWTGNLFNWFDAVNTAPDQDRLLFDLFTAAPDEDATRGQLSVNIGADDPSHDPLDGLASWSALLSGTLAFTNNQNDFVLPYNGPAYSTWSVQPYGNAISNAMWQIVTGINSSRTNYGAFPTIDGLQGVFEHVGDILRVPQLSVQSPFLNSSDPSQAQYGISDEAYEWLPQQIMGLLNVSGTPQNPPRYVVYCYGQTLKPAPNSFVSSGQYAGMCTNYQVVAESASRAVIKVQNAPTPANPNAQPHVVIEQYNTLPPD